MSGMPTERWQHGTSMLMPAMAAAAERITVDRYHQGLCSLSSKQVVHQQGPASSSHSSPARCLITPEVDMQLTVRLICSDMPHQNSLLHTAACLSCPLAKVKAALSSHQQLNNICSNKQHTIYLLPAI